MKPVVLLFLLLLSACASTEEKIVSKISDSVSINVNKVEAPEKLRVSPFKFQSPSEKNSVVGMDQENYKKFRLFLLELTKREEDWANRLSTANEIIQTLSEKDKVNVE